MSPSYNLPVLMLAALLFGSLISHAAVPRSGSPLVQPPSVIHAPTPTPAVLPSPVKSPVPAPEGGPPVVPTPSPVISQSPSMSKPPVEAPASESGAALNCVSVGFVVLGAFVIAFMA